MGILDEAIRDHLDLKRRRGAEEPELERLESEAFGPSDRPEAPAMDMASSQAGSSATAGDTGVRDPALPAAGGDPASGPAPTGAAEQEDAAFFDFAAEEGLVASAGSAGGAPQTPQQERGDASPAPGGEAGTEGVGPEDAGPALEDTQPHDVEGELTGEAATGADPLGLEGADALNLDESELQLDEPDLDLGDLGDAGPATDAAEELGPDAAAGEEESVMGESGGELLEEVSDDDVLEETPDFLRDAPESDRLWFEQGQPKDFDFDEEEDEE